MTSIADLELPASKLRANLASVPEDGELAVSVAGQDRAREALQFGLALDAEGYNIAVAGAFSSGRRTLAMELVTEAALSRPDGRDWVYLHNFEDPRRPRVVSLPAGRANDLARDLDRLIHICREDLPAAFASEAYERRVQEALAPVMETRSRTLEMLQNTATALGFAVNATPMGLLAAPLRADGQPMAQEEFVQLPKELHDEIEARGERVQEALNSTLRQLRQLDAQARQAVTLLDEEITNSVNGPSLEEMKQAFGEFGMAAHLEALAEDIVKNLETFKRLSGPHEGVPPQLLQQFEIERDAMLARFKANVLVTHEPGTGGPVEQAVQPTFHELFGYIEFEHRFGNLVTDFTQIRPGAIHGANGGYLVLQAEDLLSDIRGWPQLKRTLNSRQIRFDDPAAGFPLPVVGIAPEGIPLDLKVVLVGPPLVFAILDAIDHEFGQMFKVRADFEPDVLLSKEAVATFAGFVRRTCRECELRPFDSQAIEELLHFGTRMADRQDRLSTQLGVVADLCKEANHFAVSAGSEEVERTHVRQAIDARRRRAGLVPDRIRQLITERTLRIETSGAVIGQVNGLAVVMSGGNSFGIPMRITCRTGAGRRGVVAIERETERSGSIHTKGVLVLQGFLMGLFGRDRPLTFNASLTFEQSYDEVEGDSASSAELYVILASLADLPVRQDIAVTGSVDQFGSIQAVGGVTHKVEGFFDICAAAGLTGTQGVIIPAANVVNLNLRPDVVAAVADGQFHVWEVTNVTEAIELLTGMKAGERDGAGEFPAESVLGKVEARLRTLREHAAAMGDPNVHMVGPDQ